jgi:uncharacterized membrane protein YcfT
MVIDEFASRFVYFYTGYLMAAHIFTLAKRVEEQPEMALALLTAWGLINGFLVLHRLAEVPLGSLAPRHGRRGGNSGGSALIASSRIASPVDYFGRNSIVIYLACFLPMAASRALLMKTGWITDVGTVSVLVTIAGVVGALVLFWAVRSTFLRFLFERSERFWIAPKRLRLQPAQ